MENHNNQIAPRSEMPLSEHLEELRRRVIYAMLGLLVATGLTMIFGKEMIQLLQTPYLRATAAQSIDAPPVALTVTDGFLTYVRVSLLGGLILASPWVCYQLWLFVVSGLHERERRYVRWTVPFAAGLFVGGAAFFLFVIAETLMGFFIGFTAWMQLQPVIQLRELIAFMTNLMLVFGLAFQTPIIVFLLARTGLVAPATLTKFRRHVIVGMLILAAAVTSPSPVDQIALAGPMWLLYELGIVLAKVGGRRAAEAEPHGRTDHEPAP